MSVVALMIVVDSNELFYSFVSQDTGGLMAMSDAYCRVNRARGLELLSPEDFFKACNYMEKLKLPIICRKFDSGVLVLQLQSKTDFLLEKEVSRLVSSFNFIILMYLIWSYLKNRVKWHPVFLRPAINFKSSLMGWSPDWIASIVLICIFNDFIFSLFWGRHFQLNCCFWSTGCCTWI